MTNASTNPNDARPEPPQAAEHTKEPWRIGGDAERFLVYGADDRPVMTKKRPADNQRPDAERHANVLRCIACVNFCAGTPTPALAPNGLAGVVGVLDSARAEIRCLYQQLTGKRADDATGSVKQVLERITAALAALKGE